MYFLGFCSARVLITTEVKGSLFSASSLNLAAMKWFTTDWKHPHLSRKASCLASGSSLVGGLTQAAASHCSWCATGAVPYQEGWVTFSWVWMCSVSLGCVSMVSVKPSQLGFLSVKVWIFLKSHFFTSCFSSLGLFCFVVWGFFGFFSWDFKKFWMLHVFLGYVWGTFMSFNFFFFWSFLWQQEKQSWWSPGNFWWIH